MCLLLYVKLLPMSTSGLFCSCNHSVADKIIFYLFVPFHMNREKKSMANLYPEEKNKQTFATDFEYILHNFQLSLL